ncbi:MAG: divergent polysaccharide deacetylase family protein [Deltaproteobacteria bacterium]|nr:divergent polysaccharide deacetylase family protein [Deltaproteobacteria bacterium]
MAILTMVGIFHFLSPDKSKKTPPPGDSRVAPAPKTPTRPKITPEDRDTESDPASLVERADQVVLRALFDLGLSKDDITSREEQLNKHRERRYISYRLTVRSTKRFTNARILDIFNLQAAAHDQGEMTFFITGDKDKTLSVIIKGVLTHQITFKPAAALHTVTPPAPVTIPQVTRHTQATPSPIPSPSMPGHPTPTSRQVWAPTVTPPPTPLPQVTPTRLPREPEMTGELSPKQPKVVIIIDDMGYHYELDKKLLALDPALTFSILPFSPHGKQVANEARRLGREIMLHMPMEPASYPRTDPGPGALLTTMSSEELLKRLGLALDDVPFVVGVNNHMGSAFTTNAAKLEPILTEIKKRNLYFVDSQTSDKSVAFALSRRLGVRTARRAVFLDNRQNHEAIVASLHQLIHLAETGGEALAICHPHQETYLALKEQLPLLKAKVVLERASHLVR